MAATRRFCSGSSTRRSTSARAPPAGPAPTAPRCWRRRCSPTVPRSSSERVLPKMASGEEIWAQAWSEPESGSDLASLRSTATRTDGGWKLNGQKIWSSRAPFGDRAFGLFRSNPDAQRHKRPDLRHVRPEGRRRHRAPDRPTRRRHRFRRDLPRRRLRARRRRHRDRRRRLARCDEHVQQRARHVVAQPGALPRARRTPGAGVADRTTIPRSPSDVADAWIKAQAYRLAHLRHRHPAWPQAANSAPNRR